MKYTNIYNLPAAFVNAIGEPHEPKPNRYGATDISGPPLLRRLKEKYWDDLEQDVSDMIWLLFGKSMHYVLEVGVPDNGIAEEKLTYEHNGHTIVSITDLWDAGIISDYKVTSVYAFLLGEKQEWTTQLNVNRLCYEHAEFPVDKLQIHAVLRDWQKGKSLSGDGYPKIPAIVKDIPKIDVIPVIDSWLERYHNEAPCTPEEKWERPTTYAVMKDGRKTALRVLGSEEEAREWAANNVKGEHRIDVRKGIAARCEGYCLVRDFCPNRKVA